MRERQRELQRVAMERGRRLVRRATPGWSRDRPPVMQRQLGMGQLRAGLMLMNFGVGAAQLLAASRTGKVAGRPGQGDTAGLPRRLLQRQLQLDPLHLTPWRITPLGIASLAFPGRRERIALALTCTAVASARSYLAARRERARRSPATHHSATHH